MPYPYEFISLYFVDSGEINAPAIYAHEILHCFGAPDLYAPDDEYGIGDSFVSWIGENSPNDIMISICARGGIDIYTIVDQLNSTGTCPSYAVRSATRRDTSKGACCPMAVGNALIAMRYS